MGSADNLNLSIRKPNMNKILTVLRWIRDRLKALWRWYRGLYRGTRWYVKVVAVVATCIVAFFVYFGMVDINFLWLFGKSPGFAQIKNPVTSEASEIYSADGVLIGKFFSENRTPVKYEDVNPAFWDVLIDTEDERYYHHHGIDALGLLGAVKDAVLRHEARGGSTITQQLAKNMFRVRTQYSTGVLGHIPGVRMLIMKSKEWIIATKLELLYSKEEILTMYANTVDFGSNAFGIKTACKTYFNTTTQQLTTEQAAVLIGMLKATTYYNPKVNPENSLRRRNVVLGNMVAHGHLTQQQCDSLCAMPLQLSYSVEGNYDGRALYFREAVADHLAEWCRANDYDLYSSGLKIYTTVDSRMQKYAEAAVVKQMRQVQRTFDNHWGREDPWRDERHNVIPDFIDGIVRRLPVYKNLTARFPDEPDSVDYYLNLPHTVKVFDYEEGTKEMQMSTLDSIRYMVRFMHCGFVAMEPQTGEVKAWVGDIDYGAWKYDKVTAMRQPGSTFKLFVYAEAMNQGLTPCDKRRDTYFSMQVFDKQKNDYVRWAPTNADGIFTGDSIPLKGAFARSTNSIAVRIGQEVGIKRIIETAHKMGIKSKLDDAPSLALGSCDVTLLELVNAYCTVADDGMHTDPVLVTTIVDRDGNVVYNAAPHREKALSYRTAFLMQQMLLGGLREPGGTSQNLWGYVGTFDDVEWGGKTGTSNNHSDAWFVGVSPKLVVGAWVGGEYRCIHFRTGLLGQGSRTALPVCGYFLNDLLADHNFDKYHEKFARPRDNSVTSDMYICPGYYPKPAGDALDSDTIEVEEEIVLDEYGNPIEATTEQ